MIFWSLTNKEIIKGKENQVGAIVCGCGSFQRLIRIIDVKTHRIILKGPEPLNLVLLFSLRSATRRHRLTQPYSPAISRCETGAKSFPWLRRTCWYSWLFESSTDKREWKRSRFRSPATPTVFFLSQVWNLISSSGSTSSKSWMFSLIKV